MCRMANEITGGAVARFHAMITVESFRTHFVAPIAHPAGKTNALAIVLSTFGIIFATALLTTVRSVETVGANCLAVGAGPPRRTLAHASFVRAFTAIFAGTLQTALRTVCIRRARMFTRGSNVTRSTAVLSGYVIASGIAVHRPWATFLAAMTKESVRTGLITIRSGPAPRADAFPSDWIAGRIVVTCANLGTALSVQSHLTATLAANTAPVSLADTLPGCGVTSQRIFQVAITALRTILSKSARLTFLFALFSAPTCRACTLAIDRITNSAIRTVATLGTVLAIAMRITRSITPDSLPTGGAEALACFGCARGPVLTLATFTAILTVRSIVALLFTDFSLEAGNAVTGAVDMIAGRVIFAIAGDRAVLAIL